MTVNDVLTKVSRIKPHAVAETDMIAFLDDLEADISMKVFNGEGYITIDSLSQELMLPREFDRIYAEYLFAKIDWIDGRIDLYSMSQSQFEATYNEMVKHYHSNGSVQLSTTRFKNYF